MQPDINDLRRIARSSSTKRAIRRALISAAVTSAGFLAPFARNSPDGSRPGWEDAIWSGTDPNVIYGHTGLNIWAYNVQSTQYTLVKNFGSELPPGNLQQMSKSIDDQVFGFTTQDTNYAA